MKIGIFDSGIGGLTVLHQAMITLPSEDYIFYADVDHVPYGEKTNELIIQYVDEAIGFLVQNDCKAIVIACNTATSVAINYLRSKYSVPIIGIEPAVKPAVAQHGNKRVMVVATPVTTREQKLKNLIMKFDNEDLVDVVALPGLVRFAQAGEFSSMNVMNYLNNSFGDYDLNNYSELVLGCTHFNFFKDSFAKLFSPDIDIIDGSLGVSNNLKETLAMNHLLDKDDLSIDSDRKNGSVEYYYSGRKVTSKEELSHINDLHVRLEYMRRI